MSDIRELVLKRLIIDLVGPITEAEIIEDRPSDRYLTGILFPPQTSCGAEQDDDAEAAGDGEEGGSGPEAVASFNAVRPSTAGLSFAIRPENGSLPAITVRVTCGQYFGLADDENEEGKEEGGQGDGCRAPTRWQRTPRAAEIVDEPLAPDDAHDIDLSPYGINGMTLHVKTSPWNGDVLVTAVVANANELPEKPRRKNIEESAFFQVSMEVVPSCGSMLLARPLGGNARDEDGLAAALIYRDASEYAVGHTCSAEWDTEASKVRTSWIPVALVPATSADGDEVFAPLKKDAGNSPFSASWLAESQDADLLRGLGAVVDAYGRWASGEARKIPGLPTDLREQAEKHLAQCEEGRTRMARGIELLASDADLRLAFRLANRAMLLQRHWSEDKPLVWRPFQLAFCLLALASVADPESDDRGTMDLLWFPTGGGKTEAYLLLTAFAIFVRRLRGKAPGWGGGVTVFMRYTLRLLTVQQYQRAAALICACELVRLGRVAAVPAVPERLAKGPPISLGLWVGQDSSPNTVEAAVRALQTHGQSTPAQLKSCPCCKAPLKWEPSPRENEIWAMCRTPSCDVAKAMKPLPVWTVDEDVYRVLPSLLIGTADKFAQIVRKPDTGRLFGIGTDNGPPDLVIQDELHLISGPLGTMAGVYEVAVDELCSWQGHRPKVIGSTATIRRAEDQIRALFDRDTFQFPPPGIDHDNSGFAMADREAPGRLYVGVTTAGRSAKFTLQAVSASLLQATSAPSLTDAERDPYWTLVAYFNSLRELGGALVLMQDDVVKSVADFARRHGEAPRQSFDQVELTSRVDSADIPEMLEQLGTPCGQPGAVDVTLASNMISVGVDIPRLGLMVVNGQPKGIAEYIQATSRVGRGRVSGLVVAVYNANKARDRSHYESFRTWHQCLYREVEATSVTPFSPRACDRALHAALVAMARHLVPGLAGEPVDLSGFESDVEELARRIVERADRIDPEETEGVRRYLERKIEQWLDRGAIPRYWDDFRKDGGLLVSAEKAAELSARRFSKGMAWVTPNSLRSIEASVEFVLRDSLSTEP